MRLVLCRASRSHDRVVSKLEHLERASWQLTASDSAGYAPSQASTGMFFVSLAF